MEKGQTRTAPAKVKAVAVWSTPTNRKQLQRFLSFANFYRRFIHDYSRVATHLTKLTSIKVPFEWSAVAQAPFLKLKALFCSAPVLSHSDPTAQFFVEVAAPDSAISRHLTPAEKKL